MEIAYLQVVKYCFHLLFLLDSLVPARKGNDRSNGSHCPVHIGIVHSSYLTYD